MVNGGFDVEGCGSKVFVYFATETEFTKSFLLLLVQEVPIICNLQNVVPFWTRTVVGAPSRRRPPKDRRSGPFLSLEASDQRSPMCREWGTFWRRSGTKSI